MRGLVNRAPQFFLAENADFLVHMITDGGSRAEDGSGAGDGFGRQFGQHGPAKPAPHPRGIGGAGADGLACILEKNRQSIRHFKGKGIVLKKHIADVRQHDAVIIPATFIEIIPIIKKPRTVRVHIGRRQMFVQQLRLAPGQK